MNAQATALLIAVGIGTIFTSAFVREAVDTPMVLRVEADAVSATDAMEKSAEGFTRETGVQVAVEKYGYESSTKKATEDLASKTGKYDIVIQNNDALGKFASQGWIFTVDELEKESGKKADFEDDLFPRAWRGLSWYKGVRYGYPLAANTMFVLYRKDMIDNAADKQAFRERYGHDLAPPQDWKQYRDIAEFFTRPDQKFYGTLLQGKRFPAVWFEWLNFAFSFGGGVMEKEFSWDYGPIVINSPETIQATEYYDSLKKFSPAGITNFTWDDAVGQMRDGHIFMCILWSDALFHVVDPKVSTVVGKVGYAPLPSGNAGRVAQIAGSTYMVSRNSRHPREAFEFELWMLRRENQIQQELGGGASARQSVYRDPRVLELPYATADSQSLAVARNMIDTSPETPQISEVIEASISDVLADKKSTRQALDGAAVELHKLLGNKAPLKYPVSPEH
ncbi:MAG: sugar ABC transporter substrate-binding protein [Candidatus Acidiferrales bacterium]